MKKVRIENKDLIGRLYNFKFEQALQYLEGEEEEIKEIVQTLARTFGDSGWIDGDISYIVGCAVESIIPEEILKRWNEE